MRDAPRAATIGAEMRVQDVMTADVLSVSSATPLKEVAALLAARSLSGVPVVADGVVVGIVSESDLVAKEEAPEQENVRKGILQRLFGPRRRSLGHVGGSRRFPGEVDESATGSTSFGPA